MKNRDRLIKILKLMLMLFGAMAVYSIIKGYGFKTLVNEMKNAGTLIFALILTFIPTLLCYSISWICLTNFQKSSKLKLSLLKKIFIYFKITTVSMAWNNITPFFKVGGEPLKYFMLKRYINRDQAISSTINYNIIHIFATLASFIICAFIIPITFDVDDRLRLISFSIGILGLIVFISLINSPTIFRYLSKLFKRFKFLRKTVLRILWSIRQLRFFYRENPSRVIFSFAIDVFARFIEGLIFYFSFKLLNNPIAFVTSTFLDVGRTFIDNVLFFIPYQVGVREQGISIFMNQIFNIGNKGFLSAVLMYRFVEISWIVIGYFWGLFSYRKKVNV